MRKKLAGLLVVFALFAAPTAVVAHTNAGIHTHIVSHGIVGDGGGWYHSSTVGNCAGGWIPTLNKHYTYLAAKQMHVWQHTKVASKPC